MDLSIAVKLDALIDVERLSDPPVVPFLLDVLTETREPAEVRLHALKRVRDGRLINLNGFRESVARAMLRVLQDQRHAQLRLHAALALAEFTEVDGVPTALGATALDHDVPLDLRYSAFASLERASPVPECVALVRELLSDDALGVSASSLLSLWRLGNSDDA